MYVKISLYKIYSGSAGAPGAVPKHGRTFTTTGPNRGQGILTQPGSGRIPICGSCGCQIRLVMVIITVACVCTFARFKSDAIKLCGALINFNPH